MHVAFRWACLLMLPFWFESISFFLNVPWLTDQQSIISYYSRIAPCSFFNATEPLTAIHFSWVLLGGSFLVCLIQNVYLICHQPITDWILGNIFWFPQIRLELRQIFRKGAVAFVEQMTHANVFKNNFNSAIVWFKI